jgi:hypothetical protein
MTDRVDRIGATDKVFWVSIATFATAIIVLYGLGCFVLLDTRGQTAMTQIIEAVTESRSTRSDVAPHTGDPVSSGAGTQLPDAIEARALLPPVAQSPPPVDTRPEEPGSRANFKPPKYEASDTILTPTGSSTEGPLADEITLEPTTPEQFGREPSIPVEQARVDPDASVTTMPAASTIDEGAFRAFQIFRSQNGSYIDARSVTVEAASLPSGVAAPPRVVPLARGPVELKTLTLENGDGARNSVSPTNEASVSVATGAPPGTEVSALTSAPREATPAPLVTKPPVEHASDFPVATALEEPPASERMTAAKVAKLLARGDALILLGDIASARAFYQRAAEAGDGQAALRVGATFDPAFLSRAGLRGTLGDPVQARSWYRRGFDLGAAKSESRRNGLETR